MSAIPTGLLRFAALLGLLCSVNIACAQNYQKLNRRIDSLIEIGLPKSALGEVEKLDQLARKEKNVAMQVKAVIYRMTFQAYIEENAQVAIINRLKQDVADASFPVKPVLQSILAEMFHQYYRQNRYQFAKRSRLEKPVEDFTEWDLTTLINQTTDLYKASLSDTRRDQMTPIDILDGVLTGDKGTRYLLPTLYDFLLNRALSYFESEELTLIKPKQTFSINDPNLFSDSETFANQSIPTSDTSSTYYNGLKYLQQATRFHLQKSNDEALAHLDLVRFKFLSTKASFAEKDSLYIIALKQLASKFASKPISTDALMDLAQFEKNRNHLKAAMEYAQKAIATFPDSHGALNAGILIQELNQKTLRVTTENPNVPNEPILAHLDYRNIHKVNFKVYPLTNSQYKEYVEIKNQYARYKSQLKASTILLFLQKSNPIQSSELTLPDPQDWASHSTDFKIDALIPGNYLLLMKDLQSADTSLMNFTDFKVSWISEVARTYPDGKFEIRVMNRKTGEPIKNVVVQLTCVERRSKTETVKMGTTDSRGMYIAENRLLFNNTVNEIQLISQGDTLAEESKYLYFNLNLAREPKPVSKTVLFTDRQIYRPGQTIYFKGLQLNVFKEKSNIESNKAVKIDLIDPHNKSISSLNLVTNEFGTFTGTFAIPQNILNGFVRLQTPNGVLAVHVEEYKRISFKAEFLPVKESYKINDSIKVKGLVTAFSGYGLSQTRIIYHVTRKQGLHPAYPAIQRNYYPFPEVTEIKNDTTTTDNQGRFLITFKATPKEKADLKTAYYVYSITLDATDGSGETHSANTSFAVANNAIALKTFIPEEYKPQDSSRIVAGIENLNGQPQKGTIRVQIFALQSQSNLVNDRLWPTPDQFLMTQNEFKAAFPYFAYRDEDDFKKWPRGQQVSDSTIQVTDSTSSFINLWPLRNQHSGLYQIVIHAQNDRGDTTSVTKIVNLIADQPKVASFARWIVPVRNFLKPGEQAEFLVGSDEPVNVLVEKLNGYKSLSSRWMHLAAGLQKITVPIAAADSNVNVQFMMVKQNRVYTSYQAVNIIYPIKNLTIKTITFRNKLQPGEKEQWKLQVSGADNEKLAAEMVAGLYDASLDDLAPPQDWKHILFTPQAYKPRYFSWNTDGFIRSIYSTPLNQKYYYFDYRDRQYEKLDMPNYIYYGNYLYQDYQNKLSAAKQNAINDQKLEADYLINAALVKDGVEVTGKLIDSKSRNILHHVTINIKGTEITTTTNSKGYFKIKVPVDGILVFTLLGYQKRELIIKKAQNIVIPLNSDAAALNEKVVVGYGRQRDLAISPDDRVQEVMKTRNQLNEAPVSISIADVKGEAGRGDTPLYTLEEPPQSDFSGDVRIVLRGIRSLNSGVVHFAVIDGELSENFDANKLNPDEIESVTVLNGAEAIARYGAKASGGAIIITTKNGHSQQPIQTRKNFNETAFFYPQLRTDEKGEILIDFTIPEALTQWRFKAFAHTKDLQTGYLERMIVTQKQLSISTNTPRFLREGDTITISARLANLTTAPLRGNVQIRLFNALNMQPVSLLINPKDAKQNFDLAASTNKSVSFKLLIPAGLEALTYKLTADAGQFTDGEENTLPILPNRMLVTESMPMMVRPEQERSFTFEKLVNQNSPTLKTKTLTLEYTQNPVWYAIQAMPYMMEFPYECSEQIFSRYYANSLATNLVNKFPVIKTVFDQWKNTSSPELLSNLEKNPELKATLLEETPWLGDATNESEQKKRVALLFELNKMSYELQQNLDKLEKKQLASGAFPWFGGQYPDRYITQHILEGIGQLVHMGVVEAKNQTLKSITDKALTYLDRTLTEDADFQKKNETYEDREISSLEIHSYFTKSFFTERKESVALQPLLNKYLQLAEKQWVGRNIYEQAMIALTMQRNNQPEVAQMIFRSLNETAQHSEELGMYWAKNQLGYYWYQSPIETQSLMIELFTEVANDSKAVEEMKIWLLRNKQTTNWKTTKATAAACYALLMNGGNWQENDTPSVIKLDGKSLEALKPEVKSDAGTGYIKTSWVDEQVKRGLGKVTIQNKGKTISWGALHWQYLENLDKISSSQTDIQLERKYFIEKPSDSGPVLTAVDATHRPHTGDLLKVVVYLKAGRDYEYVQLKDMRPSGTEPVDVISSFKYQDGLYYYQVTKDVATNFFISNLPKGSYVFEYRLWVVQPGNFSTGITSVQSMYAPEFNAHSEGTRISISPN